MPATFKLAHISDLHFSDGADGEAANHAHSIPHLRIVQRLLEAKGPFDRVVVTGDLTNRGDRASLLRVRDWLFGEFSVSADEKLGLNLPLSLVRIIPGNHDAYNCESSVGSPLDNWQKSLHQFYQVFPTEHLNGCHYDWIEKDGNGLFIALIDSCYLGDPTLDNVTGIRQQAVSRISKIARGKISYKQSRQLLRWCDQGMAGQLLDRESDRLIAKDVFAKSLKVVAMHHYLFEPAGHFEDFFLRTDHRDIVFKNLVMADVDMSLCGHKHVNDFKPMFYGQHLDVRGKGRYLINLFRRTLGISTLPFQLSDTKGRKFGVKFTQMFWMKLLHTRSELGQDVDSEEFIERAVQAFVEALDRPFDFIDRLRKFSKEYACEGSEFVSEEFVEEIQNRLCSRLTIQERIRLKGIAELSIGRIIRQVNSRPFIQSMTGSSGKASDQGKSRSVNLYEIEFIGEDCKVTRRRYDIFPGATEELKETPQGVTFSNLHRLSATIV